jgi:hypothetical protein
MANPNIKERIKIWKGLENFRQILLDLLAHDIRKINQKTLDRLFSSYGFLLQDNRRDILIAEITKELKRLDPSSDEALTLKQQLSELNDLDDEIIIKKITDKFSYEYVFKSKETQINLEGFVKIVALDDPRHRALVSWQAKQRYPILFLAELVPENNQEKIYFHLNIGKEDGLAVIEECENCYRWTHTIAHDYPDLETTEFGAVVMDKVTKNISLEDGNLPAAVALSKAQTINSEGVTVLENNIALLNMYKKDLQGLDFNY